MDHISEIIIYLLVFLVQIQIYLHIEIIIVTLKQPIVIDVVINCIQISLVRQIKLYGQTL